MTVKPEESNASRPDPAVIIDLAVAYRGSMALLTASRLGVFTHLSRGPASVDLLAERCGASARPLEMLLNTCVAFGLIERRNGNYCNSAVADTYLVDGRPAYIGDGLRYAEDLYPAWGKLESLLRTGTPVVRAQTMLGGDDEKTRNFILGMHNRALGIAAALPYGVDLTGRKHLLDVGGGPGTYSILLAQQTPGLQATVLDLPGVVKITQEIIAGYGLQDRVAVRPGDYTKQDFGKGFDVVLLSGMMHRETPETCRLLLSKAFACLQRGGLVVVSDVFFENEDKDQPLFATHFALNMMLTSEHGSAHSHAEMQEWLRQAGFAQLEIRCLPPPNPHSLVLASKP